MQCRGFEGPCDRCGAEDGVELEPSRTAYEPTPLTRSERLLLDDPLDPPDPNQPVPLCRECAEGHHAYWDEMWADYNSGRL
jgi:hypothetical protein